jgi:DNA-binding transcriptional ArsR family regulator
MQAVKVIRDPKAIRVLADPVRREILRLISIKPLTETQLSGRLILTKPSTGHHLQVLRKSGLIKIGHTRVGSYGILEKFYEPKAKLFIEDWDKVPPELRRYFLFRYVERLRGMLSAFQLLAEKRGKTIEISSDQLMDLAQEIARRIPTVGEKHEKMNGRLDREMLIIKIYTETLKDIMAKEKWKDFFKRFLT